MQSSSSYGSFQPTTSQPQPHPQASSSRGPLAGDGPGLERRASGRRGDRGRAKPRILFMGAKNGGKSSIRKVVFERMAPDDTKFIEKNSKRKSEGIETFVDMDLLDLPGGVYDPSSSATCFSSVDSVVYVLDAQQKFSGSNRSKLISAVKSAFSANDSIWFEVFLHKVDQMSEDYQSDLRNTIIEQVKEELEDVGLVDMMHQVEVHLTSVFDTSVFRALSLVVQRLLPEQATLERLLDMVAQQCGMEKVFLFDMNSKLYLATDSAQVDVETYDLCSHWLDLVSDFRVLYEPTTVPLQSPSHSRSPSTTTRAPLSPLPHQSPASSSNSPQQSDSRQLLSNPANSSKAQLLTTDSKHPGATIAHWTIDDRLSLIAIVRPHMVERHAALLEFNVDRLREAVVGVFDLGVGKLEEW